MELRDKERERIARRGHGWRGSARDEDMRGEVERDTERVAEAERQAGG